MTPRPTPTGLRIDSDARLLEHWVETVRDDGFLDRTLWVLFLDVDDRALPVMLPLDGIPRAPHGPHIANLMRIVTTLAREQPGLGIAALIARPGDDDATEEDRIWARTLVRAAHERRIRTWPVALATRGRVQVLDTDGAVLAGRR